MPDIVYDPKNPEIFRDTWIKAYYNDKIFTCLIYGGNTASRDVNAYDQNGNLLRPLLGDYTIAVTISKGETVLAHTSLDITIADYPEKVLARFSPDEHMGRVTYDAAIHDWMLLLDPFPGYWNMPMFFPEWKLPYQGSIGWKWRHNDALEYSGGRIHMYLYGTSISSTSYSVELAKLQLQADLENPARLIPRYYSIGEPTLPGINERGYFIDMEDDEYLVFTRVDREEFANKENEIDMDSLLTMQSETDLTRLIRADWGDTLAFCGVCRPIQTDTMEYDLESGAYSWSNGFDRIEYNVNADDEYTFSWTSPISLTRKYSNGTNTTSAFEFRTNFLIEELYEGRILDVTARLIDDEGNPLTDYMKCCSIYVDEQYPSKSKQ